MPDVTVPDECTEAAAVLRAMAEHGIRVDDRKFERYVRALLAEYDRRGQIEQRAQLIAGGRPARPDRHVALALSVTDGPSPKQAAFTANWILTGGPS